MERGIRPRGYESQQRSLVRVCNPEETKTCLTAALGGEIETSTQLSIERGHISLLRVGGATVLCYGFEYQDPDTKEGKPDFMLPLPMDLHSLIANKRARILLTEYFAPELQRNIQQLGRLGRPLQKRYRESLDYPDSIWHTRLSIAEVMTRFCEQSGMRVAVADIADTPLYMAERSAQVALYFVAAGWLSRSATDLITAQLAPQTVAQIVNTAMALSGALITRGMVIEAARTSLPNPLEDLFIYGEDARRHFLAQGIRQLAGEYGQRKNGDPDGFDIIVAYPPAHLRRVINHLTDPKPWKTAKRHLYRGLQPGLHHSVRTWQYKSGYSGNPHWEKTSDRPIR